MKGSRDKEYPVAQRVPPECIDILTKILMDWHSDDILERKLRQYGVTPQGTTREDKWRNAMAQAMNIPGREPGLVLGSILQEFMEVRLGTSSASRTFWLELQKATMDTLAKNLLMYGDGRIYSMTNAGLPSRSLQQTLALHDGVPAVDRDFALTLADVERNPPSAIMAAGRLLEHLFQEHITRHGLVVPAQAGLMELWKVVRQTNLPLGSSKQYERLLHLLEGLVGIVAAFRNQAAHGSPEEFSAAQARLVVHVAHSLGTFIAQTWEVPAQEGLGPGADTESPRGGSLRKAPQSEKKGVGSAAHSLKDQGNP